MPTPRVLLALLMAVALVPVMGHGATGSAVTAAAPKAPAGTPPAQRVRFVIQPPQEAQLASQMSGKLLRYFHAEGAAFRKGDRLVEFDCEERKAQMEKALATRGKAEKTEISQKKMLDLRAISDLEYEIAKANLAEAGAEVAMAQAQVNQCYIQAPYAGRVVRRIANQHEHMNIGTPLMKIIESGPLRLEMLVPSTWLKWLKPGVEFSITIEELQRTAKARVISLGARIDPASQTIYVRADFMQEIPGLLPGMSGIADFGAR